MNGFHNDELRRMIMAAPLASATGYVHSTAQERTIEPLRSVQTTPITPFTFPLNYPVPSPLPPLPTHDEAFEVPEPKRFKSDITTAATTTTTAAATKKFQFDPHAGLLSEFGGVKKFLQMQRGELPWPSSSP